MNNRLEYYFKQVQEIEKQLNKYLYIEKVMYLIIWNKNLKK